MHASFAAGRACALLNKPCISSLMEVVVPRNMFEGAQSPEFLEGFKSATNQVLAPFLAEVVELDESHCESTWTAFDHDFETENSMMTSSIYPDGTAIVRVHQDDNNTEQCLIQYGDQSSGAWFPSPRNLVVIDRRVLAQITHPPGAIQSVKILFCHH